MSATSYPSYDWAIPESKIAREHFERSQRLTWSQQTTLSMRPDVLLMTTERHRLAAVAQHASESAKHGSAEGLIPLFDVMHDLWATWLAHGEDRALNAFLLKPGEVRLTPAHPMSRVDASARAFISNFFAWLAYLSRDGETVSNDQVNAVVSKALDLAVQTRRLPAEVP